ncbi:MAG: DUF4920 domain-containing protein [Crocinitomicaceae bacterium]
MIRFFLFSVIAAFVLNSCGNTGKPYKSYGAEKVDSLIAIDLNDMLQQLEQNPEKLRFTFTAPIEEVCQTAGCWATVQKDNGELLRVRFKDHFLIPKNTRVGSVAYFRGEAYWDTVSVELQKHFAEDSKMSQSEIRKINSPKFELNFEAAGVLVEDVNASKK